MGKGGSKAPTSQTITQNSIPGYAEPYYMRLMDRAEGQSLSPYTPYGGQRLAQPTPDVNSAYDLTRQVAGQGIAGLTEAAGVTADTVAQGQQIANASQPYQYDPTQLFTSSNVGQYMSPYMQQVLDVQKDQARRQYDETRGDRNTAAVNAGAFGGSRRFVQEGMAERDMLNRMSDIQATGQQNAFQSAQQALQSDRQALFGREQAQAGEDAQAQARRLAALGYTGDQAMRMVALGEAGRASDIQSAQLLETIGEAQQGQEQQNLDIAYQDYLRQQDYPAEQLNRYAGLLHGVPTTVNSAVTGYAPYSPITQALGAGLGGIGLYKGLQG